MKISVICSETNTTLPINNIDIDENNKIIIKVGEVNTIVDEIRTKPECEIMIRIRSLSRRERECMYYAALGHTAKEISEILAIGKRTVESHIARAKCKLNLKYKYEIVQLLSMDRLPKPEDFFITSKISDKV